MRKGNADVNAVNSSSPTPGSTPGSGLALGSRPAPGSGRRDSGVAVTRLTERLQSDERRVISRYFYVGSEQRVQSVVARVMALDEDEVARLLRQVFDDFSHRHHRLEQTFERHFDRIRPLLNADLNISMDHKLLIGSYFTMEYSIEAAALFNPSIVPHPDQTDLKAGEVRFIMSLRATGEGHVSSIVFRTGRIDRRGRVALRAAAHLPAKLRIKEDSTYEKKLFFLKLIEMGAYTDAMKPILDRLPAEFTLPQLRTTIDAMKNEMQSEPAELLDPDFRDAAENAMWLARSNYTLQIPPDTDPADVVIFPQSENESKGIEDVRLTRFTEDDGSVTYYGTYTAFNGFKVLPQIFETRDFSKISIHTLNGKYVQNKGMALFPRKVKGDYVMISRLDGENMFLMRSDNVYFWNQCEKLSAPRHPWEFVQIGNCGAPLETPDGWILLTHGVGPMRQYCIGVSLLDLDNPRKVIGHLSKPLLMPEEDERDGYVPNVVYSCGAMIHEGLIVMPYAISDSASRIATVELPELLEALKSNGNITPQPSPQAMEAVKA